VVLVQGVPSKIVYDFSFNLCVLDVPLISSYFELGHFVFFVVSLFILSTSYLGVPRRFVFTVTFSALRGCAIFRKVFSALSICRHLECK